MLDAFTNFVLNAVDGLGYTGIVIMMALESSFVPFPSEVVVPPAGYLCSQGRMNIYLVIASGMAGSIIGAIVNYYLAVFMGRSLLIKYGKYLFMPEEKLHRMDAYFSRHGEITTFVGRLLPVIRQYISFPAGLSRMNLPKFIFFTSLGAGVWVITLTILGYVVGNNINVIKANMHQITFVTIGVLALVIAVYVYWNAKKRDRT